MSKLKERLEKARREGIPRAPKVEVIPPKADVIHFPKDTALTVAKSERTRAVEIDRESEKAQLWEAERIRRAEALVASEAYQRAGERFNAGLAREREENWFDPTQPFGFRR